MPSAAPWLEPTTLPTRRGVESCHPSLRRKCSGRSGIFEKGHFTKRSQRVLCYECLSPQGTKNPTLLKEVLRALRRGYADSQCPAGWPGRLCRRSHRHSVQQQYRRRPGAGERDRGGQRYHRNLHHNHQSGGVEHLSEISGTYRATRTTTLAVTLTAPVLSAIGVNPNSIKGTRLSRAP